MNEVKISTKVNENNKGQLSIKLNVAAMGLKWETCRVKNNSLNLLF